MNDVFEQMQQLTWARQCNAARYMATGRAGGFAAALADAYFRADSKNRDRLVQAFADLFERFADVNA